ncbi:MAG: enoyl-CoA hydratase-related protein [Peptostreptococcaceae bacterium]|nr:enoyl-CoA hydratase-related protein [Peptostreptococcaceae bacterium]
MTDFIVLNKSQGVLTITLDNPKTLNSLDDGMLFQLGEAIDKAENDDEVRVVIITGSGKSFVAGADIKAMSEMDAAQGKKFGEKGAGLFRRIEKLSKPVIAAINGFALGGGCELAMACDIRIASNKAKFGQPEVCLGITPGFSGTQRLARIVGIGKAKELIFSGNIIDAQEAYRIGLVEQLAEPDELLNVATELANKIASNAKTAVRYAKEAINRGLQTDIDTGIDIEVALFALCFATEDQKEGMKAFLEKRNPKFS